MLHGATLEILKCTECAKPKAAAYKEFTAARQRNDPPEEILKRRAAWKAIQCTFMSYDPRFAFCRVFVRHDDDDDDG